jgi:hypothetical protein
MRPPQRPAPQAAAAGIGLARMQASPAARRASWSVAGKAGARGEAQDAQESVITRLLRHGTLASVPPPRAPARVRQAMIA